MSLTVKQYLATLCLAMFAGSSIVAPLFAQDWSGFQNQGGLNNSEWELPKKWSPDSSIAWQSTIQGYGQSSPIIHDQSIYVTSVVGPQKESVRVEAFDLATGDSKWFHAQANSSPEKNTVMVSRAASSPVADDLGVIAFFEGGDLIALDHAGSKRWSRSLKEEFGELKARHGLAGSLEQDSEFVFVWVERMESPFILALNKSDGSTAWKQEGLGATSWGSPRLIDVDDAKHLVLSATGVVAGLDPKTGDRLWEFREISGNTSSTPIPIAKGQFLIGSSGGRQGDQSKPSCGVIQVTKSGEGYSANWKWVSERATSSFGSPIAANGKAYFVNRSGIVQCHELDSGTELYTGRLPCNQIWATPLATDKHVYFFGKDGSTAIIESVNELKVLHTNKLWTPEKKSEQTSEAGNTQRPQFSSTVLYAAAVAESKLILRRGDQLYAVGQ